MSFHFICGAMQAFLLFFLSVKDDENNENEGTVEVFKLFTKVATTSFGT